MEKSEALFLPKEDKKRIFKGRAFLLKFFIRNTRELIIFLLFIREKIEKISNKTKGPLKKFFLSVGKIWEAAYRLHWHQMEPYIVYEITNIHDVF
jgi:hypothetical protein